MKVMTYNIKYATEEDGKNSWSKRKHHLTKQIRFYEPDILGMQEPLLEQIEYFEKNLEGYGCLGAKKDKDNKDVDEEPFNPVFYKKDLFEVMEESSFWLSETPDKPSKGWDGAFKRGCTYVLFKDKKDNRKFWIFNTHFDHKGKQVRKESAGLVIEKVKEINSENLPVILMGDLNSTPGTESISMLSETFNDSKKVSKVVKFGPDGTFNHYDFDDRVTERVDYIFTGKEGTEVLKYAVLNDPKDHKYPSDHFPVFVELQFSK